VCYKSELFTLTNVFCTEIRIFSLFKNVFSGKSEFLMYFIFIGLPTPLYNTPRKKCIPHSPLCGITFTCVMDVHAVDERGQRIENWWRGEEKVIEN